MVENPAVQATLNIALCALLDRASRLPKLHRLFAVYPKVVFVFFIPTAAHSFRLILSSSPFYDFAARTLFPTSLLLFITSADVRLVVRMGRRSAFVVLVGAAAVVLFAPVLFAITDPTGDPEGWKGLAAMTAVFVGGFPNMLTLK